ncbi:MAG: D-alanyl-D-alanine carboxypeptidase/D-alanyl-D-alanine-endopeptidase [Rubricoccaceae bacterium]
MFSISLLRARAALVLAVAVACAAPALVAQPTSSRSVLADQIDEVLDSEVFDDAYWGALVVDLNTGRTLYERNAMRRFIPASNMKLFSTAAILDALGPDYRYKTRLYASGPVENGTLQGSLVVRGSGDPTFGGRYTGGDLTRVLRQWADSLEARGIQRITGSVVGDDDVFDDEALGMGWSWDDLVWYYAAEISGLQFNEGTVEVKVHGTTPGEPARITVEPDNGYVQLVNQTTTTDGGSIREGYRRNLGANVFNITTTVPAGKVEEEALSIVNPTEYFVRTFKAVLKRRGIEVEGEAIDVDTWGQRPVYDGLRQLAVHTSPPLSTIAEETNTESNNLYAEHLLRTLGAERYRGDEYALGSAQAGVSATEPLLQRLGVDPNSLRIVDGSGLSAMNRLTPFATVTLLKGMKEHHNPFVWDAFYKSLAVGGYTGTIKGRYQSGDARGNVRAKTGYISGARTLSGYVMSDSGHMLAFSLMCNHYSVRTSRVNRAQDEIVEMLADFRGR